MNLRSQGVYEPEEAEIPHRRELARSMKALESLKEPTEDIYRAQDFGREDTSELKGQSRAHDGSQNVYTEDKMLESALFDARKPRSKHRLRKLNERKPKLAQLSKKIRRETESVDSDIQNRSVDQSASRMSPLSQLETPYEEPRSETSGSITSNKKLRRTNAQSKGAKATTKKKASHKSQTGPSYSELVAKLSYLDKFDWLDPARYNSKLLPSKFFSFSCLLLN